MLRSTLAIWKSLLAMTVWGGLALPAMAQGLLVNTSVDQHARLPRPLVAGAPAPAPQSSYKIKELDVHVKLLEQVARVQVSQTFVNTGSAQMEVCFVFPLPYDGAIDQLTLLVDGKEFAARLLPKDEARKTYEAIVRKNQDPALLEWLGSGMFQTSVFPVPPGAERKISLRYSQLCRKAHGLTDFLFPLSTAKYTSHPVERVQIQVALETKGDLKNVYSPTHAVEVKRDVHQATISYKGENQIPNSDFRLFYDVEPGPLGTSVLSYRPETADDGYFLLLTSPEIKRQAADLPKKTVVFVVDRSGSMSGQKIEQAKGALKFVLNNLREGDLFNIVAYDGEVESFRPELQKFTDETRRTALGFVEGLYAGGSTHIDGALSAALSQLQDSSRPNYVLFLTDGLPTAGETNELKIAANAQQANRVRARIVAFGVGYDVNSRLLDKLARANFGQSEYVRPDENIEDRVSRLYKRIESPVMTDVALKFSVDAAPAEAGEAVNRAYPKDAYDLFEGDQLVVVGRYKRPGAAKVTVSGVVSGNPQSFDFPADLAAESKDDTFAFIAKLWAMRRIGEIIDDLDLKGRNEELVKELVDLSTRYGILTPYTSFLADENVSLRDLAENSAAANRGLERLSAADGRGGFIQRSLKADLQRARQAGESEARDFSAATVTNGVPQAGAKPRRAAAPGGGGGSPRLYDLESGEEIAVDSVRNVGAKSFYRRANRWVDSTLTEEQEKQAQRVEQFSDDYFALAEKHGRKLSQYLVFDEPVLVNLDGQAFSIEPASEK